MINVKTILQKRQHQLLPLLFIQVLPLLSEGRHRRMKTFLELPSLSPLPASYPFIKWAGKITISATFAQPTKMLFIATFMAH
jgi:hypothetical protein